MLELLRALNWTIRADVPWPTQRGRIFDFVLVGDPGVFAVWVHDGDPDGVAEAAAGLGALLGGTDVRAVVCRASAALAPAHPHVLYCTPETALDLLVGLPAHANPAMIREIAIRMRDLEVPVPPEPEPEPEPQPAPEPKPKPAATPVSKPAPKVEPAPRPEPPKKTEPVRAEAAPAKAAPAKAAPAKAAPPKAAPLKATPPKTETPKTAVAKAAPVVAVPAPQEKAKPGPKPAVAPPVVRGTEAAVEAVAAPRVDAVPAPEPARPRPAGRHRSEKPRRVLGTVRRTPPPPPVDTSAAIVAERQASTLELPTALAPAPGRARGGNEAAQRFDNSYVFVPEPEVGPGPLRREFRAKAFVRGIVVLLGLVLAAGVAVKAWPHVAGLVKANTHPTATFGRPISVKSSNFHPDLTMTAAVPKRVTAARGTVTYAVAFTVSNVGSTAWRLPSRTAFVMVDSLGESHALASISGAGSSRWTGTLTPTHRWSGRLVFQLRSGRTPLRLRLTLASNGAETATWKQ